MAQNSTSSISGFHAHVYYDADSKDKAARLRQAIEDEFTVEMGRWHDRPIGPHQRWSYQVAFEADLFGELVPWLALNREDLVIFVHPRTGDDIPDHRDFALWMGEVVPLDLDALK